MNQLLVSVDAYVSIGLTYKHSSKTLVNIGCSHHQAYTMLCLLYLSYVFVDTCL